MINSWINLEVATHLSIEQCVYVLNVSKLIVNRTVVIDWHRHACHMDLV